MAKIAYLLDEGVPQFLNAALVRGEPAIEVWQVGQSPAPPKGTLDPDLLVFAEENQKAFVTMDKKTMVGHLHAHFRAGRHTSGVFLLKQHRPTTAYVDDLLLIWSTLEREEVVDWTDVLPWE